jgi:hypothetical protein
VVVSLGKKHIRYPPVIKHGNPSFRVDFSSYKPPFTGNWPRLIACLSNIP